MPSMQSSIATILLGHRSLFTELVATYCAYILLHKSCTPLK